MTRNIIISELQKIKSTLQKQYSVNEIGLFGSYARNEQNINSDIDIIVDFENKTFKNFINISRTIEDIFKNYKVQVVSKGGIKENYLKYIQEDLIYV